MQTWVLVGAWLFAALLAVVLLGFAGYEIGWKLHRLSADRRRLEQTVTRLQATAAELRGLAERRREVPPADELKR